MFVEECGMLVDELRNDPEFNTLLIQLREAITDAITTADTRGKAARFGDVSERLVEIVQRLDAQR